MSVVQVCGQHYIELWNFDGRPTKVSVIATTSLEGASSDCS